MNAPRHEMILASAGSGKTYALTHRFVQLLAGGAAPERIVALTFTRKAAGEFFDKILEKLAGAALARDRAAKLAGEIGASQLGEKDFLQMLRAVIDAMPRLNLGTLDGFFARVVRTFPLELGLDGEFQVMEEAVARLERRRVLRRMFVAAGEPDAAQREFIEAFKRATFGVEEKQLARVLDGFLDQHAETLLDAPSATQWGDPHQIWPQGCPWLGEKIDVVAAMKTLRAWSDGADIGEKQRARWHEFLELLALWLPGVTPPRAMIYVLEKALAAWKELQAGRAVLEFDRKKQELSAPACAALAELTRHVVGAELARRLEMTRGLFAVLRGYEENYHEVVRRAGRLTFADVLRLLLPGAGAPVLTGETAGEARLLIDWRLDAKFDHWLLDEFQDTSFAQWSVLRNLIDEAVQDAERRRSIFYVGDVKQAIFGWRGGDPRLFREIFEHYNRAAPGTIAEGRRDASWRSGPAVIEMVNRVFGASEAIRALVPATTAAAWTQEWRKHASAQPHLGGGAELRHAADEAGRFAETLRVLREVEPQRRGLAAAVLVRTNDTAAALVDFLRREGGLAAVAESDRHVAIDNPLTGALLALLRAAAHPGDTLAQEQVNMTPLGALLAAEGLATPDARTARVLAEIHAHGFAGTLQPWLQRLAPAIAGDAFSAERGRALVMAATEFDSTGSRGVAEFLEFAARYTVRDSDAAGVVRVMTVHKAKGLGFDVVILPDLQGRSLTTRPRDQTQLAVKKATDRSVEWVMQLPAKLFAEHDAVLAAHAATEEADVAYGNLCLLYVAMTRAKRAMYVITEPPGESASKNFPRLLADTLGGTWRAGDPRWFEQIPPPKPAEKIDAALPRLDATLAKRAPRRPARRPSGLTAAAFSVAQQSAVEFGTAVHGLLAEVEWADSADAERFSTMWTERGTDPAARDEVLACLRAPALAGVWEKNPRADSAGSPQAEVWRERAFELVLDGAWVTGVFDRVVVERNANGRGLRATVFDFKTDAVADDGEMSAAVVRHAAQLNVYRRAVARLAGVDAAAVGCALIFTRRQRCAVVPA